MSSAGRAAALGPPLAAAGWPAHLLALLGGAASTAAGLALGWRWVLPLLQVVAGYPIMAWQLGAGRRGRAVGAMLIWAAGISVTVIGGVVAAPPAHGSAILFGPAYWQEMSRWIQTGVGCESNPRCWLPQHALHLGLFLVLGLASAGIGALAMGALLINYMSYYVGQLAALSPDPVLVACLAWHPWALLRVVAFVILGVLVAEPLLRRLRPGERPARDATALAAAALGLLLLDGLLKYMLAPSWRLLLGQRVLWP